MEMIHPVKPLYSYKELKQKMRNLPGRVSTELEIVSDAGQRKLRIERSAREAEERRAAETARRMQAFEDVRREAEERAILAVEKLAEAREFIPVVPKFAAIVESVCNHFDVTLIDLISARRHKEIVMPRQIVMYIARHFTTMSYPQIGMRLGGRDHTTILSGVGKIERLLERGEIQLAAEIDNLKWDLGIQ